MDKEEVLNVFQQYLDDRNLNDDFVEFCEDNGYEYTDVFPEE